MSVWVFDLDGTLISTNNDYGFPVLKFAELMLKTFDYRAPHYSAIIKLFSDTDKERFKTMRAHRDRFPGSMVETYRELCRRARLSEDKTVLDEAWAIGASALSEECYRGRSLLPGAKDALYFLQGMGVKLCCVTAGDPAVQWMKWNGYKLIHFFPSSGEFIVVEWDKTAALETLYKQFNKDWDPPTKVFMVGDSVGSDLWPAYNAGLYPVYIPAPSVWDHGELKEELPPGTYELESIWDLPRLYLNIFDE